MEDLPAYSGDPHDLLPGRAYRIWQGGQIGSEYFMLEVRAPQVDKPYDAQVPAGNLLVYHVDETVPEGGYKLEGGGQWHLRARLVEADGNTSLADGQDDGSLADLFPGSLGVTQLTPASQPSSWGYTGNSGVALTGIVGSAAGVEVAASAVTGPLFEASLGFDSEGGCPVKRHIPGGAGGSAFSPAEPAFHWRRDVRQLVHSRNLRSRG